MKEVFLGYLSKTLNLDAERIAEILFKKADDDTLTDEVNDQALAELLKMDADRVAKLKPDTKQIFDNGYKKAQAEVAAKMEDTVRKEFGIDDASLQGEDLIKAARAALQGKGLDADKIKAHPEFVKLERETKEAIAAKEAEYAERIKEVETRFAREQTWQNVSRNIRETFMQMNPVLPADQAKADRQIEMFLQGFRELEYQQDEKEGFIPISDGKRLEDQHGYHRPLSDLVRERAEQLFEFREQSGAGNAGNRNTPPQGRTVNKRFKTEAEYLEAVEAAPTFEDREALYQAWTAQQQQVN